MKQYYFLLPLLLLPIMAQSQQMVNGRLSGQTNIMTVPPENCDMDFSFVTGLISGLAFDGATFYTCDITSRLIDKYNLNGEFVGSIPYPGIADSPGGEMDFDGTNLWVTVEQDGKLYKINPQDGAVLGSFTLPTTSSGDPNNYGCAYENGSVWSTEYLDKTLFRIDVATGAVVDQFNINRVVLPLKIINGELYGIEFVANDGADSLMQLIRFDKTNGDALDIIPLPCIYYSLGMVWADNHFWSIHGSLETRGIYRFTTLLPTEKFSAKPSVSVFPNPASEEVMVNSPEDMASIAIYNLAGSQICSNHPQKMHQTIDVSAFPKGMYLVKIVTANATTTQKLIVK
jgi:hypothetical protein